jgi:hypothetical protein
LLIFQYGRFLAVCTGNLAEIALDALVDVFQATLHLGSGEIAIPIIDGLEFATIDGDKRISK